MKAIYNTYVVMESQEQCDRMKQLCIDNGLKFNNNFSMFPCKDDVSYRYFYYYADEFCNWRGDIEDKEQITEQEFIELLKTTK